ncbi:MAG: hypothetical protein J6I57_05710 [Desulfovibrio sp.]|nr:hypothetical protein [Desulfovibrio sp.]
MKYSYPWIKWTMFPLKTQAFRRAAHRTQYSIGDICIVYLSLLEYASQNDPVGSIDGFCPDFNDIDCDFEKGTTQKIISELITQGLIKGQSLIECAGEQAGREKRSKDAERLRRWREQKKAKETGQQDEARTSDETPVKHDETLRETPVKHTDKIREDKIREEKSRVDNTHTPYSPPQGDITRESEENPKTPSLDFSHGNPLYREFRYVFDEYPNHYKVEDAWKEYVYAKDSGEMPDKDSLLAHFRLMKENDVHWQENMIPTFAHYLEGKRWEDEPFNRSLFVAQNLKNHSL